jgi:tetratricopeptide (TPR) repeat protein
VLTDQKRTKIGIKVFAIVATVAFVGGLLLLLGFVIVTGGGSDDPQATLIEEAETATRQRPNNAQAWEDLASAYQGANPPRIEEAITAAERANRLAPRDYGIAESLALLYNQDQQNAEAISTLERFTARSPRTAEAFALLGQLAEQEQNTRLAILSYSRYLELAPDDPVAVDVRDRLRQLQNPDATAPTATAAPTTTRTTTGGPVTP